jgi:2-furoyl-CoA dehydrogenase large subunit
VKAEQMPYETPNGCVYDSGDYSAALDIALELIDAGSIEERRKEAAARGKLLGFGSARRSTRDEQLRPVDAPEPRAPVLREQRGGVGEARHLRRGRRHARHVPQGQGHETTAAQVVADILGCSPDQVNVRRGHDTWFNSHAGLLGHVRVAVRLHRPRCREGRCELVRDEMIQLAAAVLQAPPEAIELSEGFARIKDGPPEAALPFMALGAIINANNAFLPPEFNPTLNHRYVCRPYFGMVDTEKKTGSSRSRTRRRSMPLSSRSTRTRARWTSSTTPPSTTAASDQPQIVEGQVHGATAHAIGAALTRTSSTTRTARSSPPTSTTTTCRTRWTCRR